MKYDIYGKFQIIIKREDGKWQVYKSGNGLCLPVYDLVIPSGLAQEEILSFLDDFYHEAATPETKVRKIE